MRSLNRRILLYLLILWGGVAAVGVIGYSRLTVVHHTSNQLLQNVYPSAEAALEVETAIHDAYKNTYQLQTLKYGTSSNHSPNRCS